VALRYRAYGLVLASERPLTGLDAAAGGEPIDVRIALGERPEWADEPAVRVLHSSPGVDGRPPVVVAERIGERGMRLRYDEGIRFHVDAALSRVWADWDAPLDEADAMTFLMGPVLGYVLRGRGVLALHASAVLVGRHLVGFVGPAGSGKSTLAAALATNGHAVLTDDVLALREEDGRWVASPALDQVRLWEESARLVFGEGHGLPSLSGTWEKRGLTLRRHGLRFHDAVVSLGGLVLLDGDPASLPAETVTPARGQEALLSIIGNTYVTYLLDDRARARELEAIGRLVAQVPVARLQRPAGGGDPAASARAIDSWVAGVTG
jgi:hypothetical protein